MKTPKSILVAALFATVALTACNRNPGWDGHKSANPTEELAEETCACLYEVMSEMDDKFDMGEVMDKVEEFVNSPEFGYEDNKDAKQEKYKDVVAAMDNTEQINDRLEDCECMKPVDDAMFNKGLDYGEMSVVLDKHCKLGIFYY